MKFLKSWTVGTTTSRSSYSSVRLSGWHATWANFPYDTGVHKNSSRKNFIYRGVETFKQWGWCSGGRNVLWGFDAPAPLKNVVSLNLRPLEIDVIQMHAHVKINYTFVAFHATTILSH